MPWSSSNRRNTLPPNWKALRQAVFTRDGFQCTHVRSNGYRCKETKNLECDHIEDNEDHSMKNLRTLCRWHHRQHTQQQAADGYRARLARRKRPEEKHPGLL